jgi:hypothetical protein
MFPIGNMCGGEYYEEDDFDPGSDECIAPGITG